MVIFKQLPSKFNQFDVKLYHWLTLIDQGEGISYIMITLFFCNYHCSKRAISPIIKNLCEMT